MRFTLIPRATTWRAAGLAGFALVILASPSLSAQGPGRSPQSVPTGDSAPRNAEPDPVILNSRTFNIPFRVDASRANPVQVDLFVSRGDGEPWQRADRQPPTIQEFRFAAPDDGIYWFATQTLDDDGRNHPSGPITPQLRVNVDTTRPVIDLDADTDDQGNVEVTVSVRDASPLRGVKLQYATDVNRQWRPVAFDTPAGPDAAAANAPDPAGRHQVTQRQSFTPEGSWQQTYLHVVAIDSAGNQEVTTDRVQRPRVASRGTSSLAGYRTPGIAPPQSNPPQSNPPQSIPAHGAPAYSSSFDSPPSGREPIGSRYRGGQPGYGNALPTSPGGRNRVASFPQHAVTSNQLPAPAQVNRSDDDFSLSPPAQAMPAEDRSRDQTDRRPEWGAANPSGAWESAPQSDARRDDERPRPGSAAEALRPIESDSLPGPDTLPGPDSFPDSDSLPEPDDGNRTRRGRELEAPRSQSPTPTRTPTRTPSRTPTATPMPQSATPAPQLQPADPSARQNRIPLPADAGPRATDNPSQSSVSGNERGGADASTIDLAELERRVPVRFSDSVRFSLDYELEAIGSRGVDSVELWGTTDAGERWKRWGTDPDLTSPFDIETLGEGIFGYRSVVVGRNGLVSPSPRDGDPPDIVVVVDTTTPEVRLTSVRYGEGDRVGSLVIRYDCSDEYLAARPITLSFSDRPDGPWTTIAAGLRNEGEYLWPADPELPRKIYLRIDALDRADNVGTYMLDQPIDAQGLAPRAKIRSFRPVTRNLGHPQNEPDTRNESGVTAARQSDPRR